MTCWNVPYVILFCINCCCVNGENFFWRKDLWLTIKGIHPFTNQNENTKRPLRLYAQIQHCSSPILIGRFVIRENFLLQCIVRREPGKNLNVAPFMSSRFTPKLYELLRCIEGVPNKFYWLPTVWIHIRYKLFFHHCFAKSRQRKSLILDEFKSYRQKWHDTYL